MSSRAESVDRTILPERSLVESAATPGGTWPADLTVVLVHGAMDRGAGMARLTRQLADAPTIRYDRRGYGHARTIPPGGFDDQIDELRLVAQGRKVVLFGHSFGGLIALGAASRGVVDTRAIVVYEAPTPWAAFWPPWPGPRHGEGEISADVAGDTAEAFLRSMIGDERWERLPLRTRTDRRAEGPALLADVSAETSAAIPFDPAHIRVPTLVAYGSASLPQYRRAAELLVSVLPQSELHRIEGAQHGAPLSHAGDVAALIRRAAMLGSVG